MIDITDFLDHIYVDMEQFIRFQRRCHLDDIECSEILQGAIQKAIADNSKLRPSSTKNNPLIEQSSINAIVQTQANEKSCKIQLGNYSVNVDAVNWMRYNSLAALDEKAKHEYLERVLNDALEDILYNNPSLFKEFAWRS